MSTPLSNALYEELGSSIRGPVYLRGDTRHVLNDCFDLMLVCLEKYCSFEDYSTVFNGNVTCVSKAVACPLDAEDVSK